MIKSALSVTGVIFLVLGFVLLDQCKFLIPYRAFIVHKYGETILVFAAVLFLNVFTGVYVACRKLFLKDTGRKLGHLEKQLRSGHSIAEELSKYLED